MESTLEKLCQAVRYIFWCHKAAAASQLQEESCLAERDWYPLPPEPFLYCAKYFSCFPMELCTVHC